MATHDLGIYKQRFHGYGFSCQMNGLAMLVKKLVRSTRSGAPQPELANKAMDYLERIGLAGSPMRELEHYPSNQSGSNRQKYDSKQIAKELLETASGVAYHGNALYVAKDIPVLTDEERFVIYRWLERHQFRHDLKELQLIAHKIAADA